MDPSCNQDAFVLLVLRRILKYLIDQTGAVLSTLEGKMSLCLAIAWTFLLSLFYTQEPAVTAEIQTQSKKQHEYCGERWGGGNGEGMTCLKRGGPMPLSSSQFFQLRNVGLVAVTLLIFTF